MIRYFIAVGTVALVLLVRLCVPPWLFEKAVYVPFFFAIAVTAAVGGMRPGLLATALSVVLSVYFLPPPEHSFWIVSPADWLQVLCFTLLAVCICWLSGSLHNARDRIKWKRTRLGAEQERFRLAAEAVNGIIYECDLRTGRVERTRGLYEVLGYRPDEVPPTADWWVEQIHPDDREATRRQFEKAATAGKNILTEYRVRHKDGRWLHVEDRAVLMKDGDGTPVKMVGCTVDVTDRKRAEQQLKASERRERERADELRTVLQATPTPIWIALDPDCHLITGNPASYRLLGMSEGENVSATPTETRPRSYQEYQKGVPVKPGDLPMQRAAATGVEAHGVELSWVFEDGPVRHILGNATPLLNTDGSVRGCVAAFMDITELKNVEQALREADRRKDEFIATLAHELRNLLAPVRNAVIILKAKGPPDPDLTWGRDVIERQVGQMARLLEDLLDVSRITRKQLELRKERVELAAVVARAVETSRPVINGGGHELTVTLPSEAVYLDADSVRLAQVFANLLNNAAKYTDRGGHIRLNAEVAGNEIVVSVKDTGIGIAPDLLPSMFDIFSQATSALERSQGGLGIGLSLVKGLVEMHGGCVEAHSDGLGKGSEFVVRLPVAVAPTIKDQPPAEAERPCRAGCRIVVADDNQDAADSLAKLLRLMGNEVRTVHDGLEAVEVAEVFRPDVVLLDIGMPRLDGYEAARRIREQPWGMDMMLVALTGWGQEDDRRRSQEAGFDSHMVKPVDLAALEELLGSRTPCMMG